MDLKQLSDKFTTIFNENDYRSFFAPGRINLIGEHTDYNGGHVFPASITKGTYALARKREDNKIRMYSLNFKDLGVIEFDINNLDYNKAHDWANYPKGMIRYLKEKGYSITKGVDVLFYGNIPNGAGLSSSASIELVSGVMFEKLFDLEIDRVELVKIGQLVENKFIGVNSGIMDQFAIGMGKKNAGILLDCDTLKYEYAPLELDEHLILIMNTNKRRELADSKYNERRSECEQALAQLRKELDVQALGNITSNQFEQHKHLIENETLQKRAKHAVYENERTLDALKALKAGDLTEFGRLLNASHTSLRDDYEVTGKELDTLAEAAWAQEGVLGARMTGAGFGGCAIALVEKDKAQQIIENIGKVYEETIGYPASFYEVSIGDGAKEL
ncbi:galactokinase [Fredinandcohnia sp. QZ13]|uniref:galactokinase n=1 Tax=Fredinandcohnia sp. QZ13 TaxID=3073144 RepID=UPI0028537146|nr:galactokinase [Fredinandcohnia sp. QZ13]MDR4889960.1 galactokinase [Fredinandcohnia sp. QZ13]